MSSDSSSSSEPPASRSPQQQTARPILKPLRALKKVKALRKAAQHVTWLHALLRTCERGIKERLNASATSGERVGEPAHGSPNEEDRRGQQTAAPASHVAPAPAGAAPQQEKKKRGRPARGGSAPAAAPPPAGSMRQPSDPEPRKRQRKSYTPRRKRSPSQPDAASVPLIAPVAPRPLPIVSPSHGPGAASRHRADSPQAADLPPPSIAAPASARRASSRRSDEKTQKRHYFSEAEVQVLRDAIASAARKNKEVKPR